MNADLDSSWEEIAATLAVSRVRVSMDTLTPASLESRWELHFAGYATGHYVSEQDSRTYNSALRQSSSWASPGRRRPRRSPQPQHLARSPEASGGAFRAQDGRLL